MSGNTAAASTSRPSGASSGSASADRKLTLTPMSGRIRGSSSSNPIRTRTVARSRSAVGMIAITRAGIVQSS